MEETRTVTEKALLPRRVVRGVVCPVHAALNAAAAAEMRPTRGDHGTETAGLTKAIKLSGLTNGFVFVSVLRFPPKMPPSFPHGLSLAEDLACLHQESGKGWRLFPTFFPSPTTSSSAPRLSRYFLKPSGASRKLMVQTAM